MVVSTPSSLAVSKCHLKKAVMRLPSLRPLYIPLSHPLRPFHSSSAAAKTDVFTNSLRKTLEAHRSTNRSRLVRKVLANEDPAGLWRPEIPPQSRADYQPSGSEPSTDLRHNPNSDDNRPKKRTKRRTQVDVSSSISRAIQPAGTNPQTPWLRHLELPRANAEITLDTEIRALEQYLTPNAQESEVIKSLQTTVSLLLKPVVPHVPKVIGSHCTGLALAHSDLDFIIPYPDPARSLDRDRRPSPTRPQIQDVHVRLLCQVEKALQHTDTFKQVQLSDRSLSARHLPTGLVLQFYCGEDVPAITEYLQDYQVEYAALRPLYATTRTLLETHGLFGTPQAGIGPDALAMLIVAFLKLNHGRFTSPNQLGGLFLALLQFYGTQVDIQSVGIAVDPPGLFSADTLPVNPHAHDPGHLRGQRSLINAKRTAAAKRNLLVAQRLCIQDPTHYMNDLGRSCTRAAELQCTLATAYQQLRGACDEWANGGSNSPSILATVVQANFDRLEDMRNQIIQNSG
ncbi:uncharacterized protein N7515_008472 [Penicillium bovifimosum]|uniref:Poly(A) RNA polymerase mitochondrial-like central palm domain-containing protein n=1 Tax=Penicillium bovifimosum TaxID=126998 RepID=A0A9W9KXJ0_9EURO|nr:uncharacterized protein N7515_008472 [Penicillium bovifimosum]KAJ5124647.1 hypothetical protein N7515_008472 [Penicillium bovifimosum]